MKIAWFAVLFVAIVAVGCGERGSAPQAPAASPAAERFIEAVLAGDVPTVEALLEADAKLISTEDDDHYPALHAAARDGRAAMVTLLLDKGADVNAPMRDNMRPLLVAAEGGHLDVVKILIERGADLNLWGERHGQMSQPIHAAALQGKKEVLAFLLDRGADVATANSTGSTPLHMAATGGHTDAIRLLLDRGAKIDVRDNAAFTPLAAAVGMVKLDAVRLLLSRGADPNPVDKFGRAPLDVIRNLLALAREVDRPEGPFIEIIKLLEAAGAKATKGTQTRCSRPGTAGPGRKPDSAGKR